MKDTLSPRAFDATHLWHPYTNVADPGPMHLITGAEGIWLTRDDGGQMIDAMSSWWCTIHGHRHKRITAAMKAQIDTLPHVMFGGLTHDPAIELGRKLVGLLPDGLDRIFYCDSGSVAVEVAMKMAVQYQIATGHRDKVEFATIRGGYHGDTWKAMSVCDPVNGMHGLFHGALQIQHFLPRPAVTIDQDWSEDPVTNGLAALSKLLIDKGDRIAALIVEPVVQGAGGMYFYHPHYLKEAKALCAAHDVLLIFDEIATGFGRTGTLFAAEMADTTPDILCLGKALTGGHISFAATVTTQDIAYGIGRSEAGVFMHGPTYMGNPLACAAGVASLSLIETGAWKAQTAAIETQMKAELAPARSLPGVRDVRVLGAIGVIEMHTPVDPRVAHEAAPRTGVWLRPFAHNIYAMPPFIIPPDDLSRVTAAMVELARGHG
ncbi:Adenosylmethionine-8-amino-7-oxononanoate aminotransferase [Aliiroseovarius sp. xm-m-379]|uniref:adenosylmethionine--8-amino-7-oxononanoate transaminase n=1 Tax=unclassified Aliiroseovarius TaxID=2623558 RepID=UPI001569943A|nr:MULTISPECIES: adenosylmethionine--8-amino-7-oxononanoate transaminase [unclassified Aliiroseovarius]NRP23459.1 Adenosylmethionine-8-amino-7-oxononanoate aminotransferase [Aliiroseovarius sp. xm-m-379]NRP29295.1 Adenosylmethionine-8-amino-7-oxononanoate aminotransferase [Aliiroseovarius sp. xm-m-314]NRP32258.1 Adenosylmethionine-8-amino-7-oxononanoate aminotransferase [Aliiroseovarius sp. xm-a-104]NRP44019.1 Adenosylmethionine-8-amino-7-oxononanoate aminotransferase [Aliiroseovarius sp. xm-m-